jgi:hypothetical protein
MARSSSGEPVLSRSVRIFEVFGSDIPAVTVTELARRTGLPLPSSDTGSRHRRRAPLRPDGRGRAPHDHDRPRSGMSTIKHRC